MEVRCNKCNGRGYISLGTAVRGIMKKCEECNGTGTAAYIKEKTKNSKNFNSNLIGQKEGLEYALELLEIQKKSLIRLINNIDCKIKETD